ncbi:hypothetical protein GE09DRAFT_646796 [Coniochaeta sp. 2T2.1]|nr:hypothetical protein GE09DRAFT_646796 [Coniochaeta sp. 2T2.1]
MHCRGLLFSLYQHSHTPDQDPHYRLCPGTRQNKPPQGCSTLPLHLQHPPYFSVNDGRRRRLDRQRMAQAWSTIEDSATLARSVRYEILLDRLRPLLSSPYSLHGNVSDVDDHAIYSGHGRGCGSRYVVTGLPVEEKITGSTCSIFDGWASADSLSMRRGSHQRAASSTGVSGLLHRREQVREHPRVVPDDGHCRRLLRQQILPEFSAGLVALLLLFRLVRPAYDAVPLRETRHPPEVCEHYVG